MFGHPALQRLLQLVAKVQMRVKKMEWVTEAGVKEEQAPESYLNRCERRALEVYNYALQLLAVVAPDCGV